MGAFGDRPLAWLVRWPYCQLDTQTQQEQVQTVGSDLLVLSQ